MTKTAKLGKATKVGKAAKTAKGRNARLPSTGLKADKTDKTANGTVTLVTDMTLWGRC